MKTILYVSAGIVCLMLAGCTAAKEESAVRDTITVADDIVLENGYYLSDNDDSYIHIEDGFIELCGYDYISDFTDSWNAYEGGKVSLDEFIENSAESLFYQIEWQEYTPVRFAGFGENGTDLVLLAVHYDLVPTTNTYIGYVFNDDGTIGKVDNNYSYYGEELPEEYSDDTAETIFTDTVTTEMTVETYESETTEFNTAESETVQTETTEE